MALTFQNSLMDGGDLTPWDPTKGGVTNPDPGVYKGKTVEWEEEHTSKSGKKSCCWTVELESGEQIELYCGTDFSKDPNRRKFLNILAAHGAKTSKLAKGASIPITADMFVGKPVFVIVKKVEGQDAQGRDKLNDREFATKEQAEAWEKAQSGKSGVTSKASKANGATPPAEQAAGQNAAAGLFDE